MTSLPENSTAKSAYAAAYAGLRIAQTLHIAELGQAIESRAINLLLGALDGNSQSFLKNIEDLEYMMALGRDAGVIHHQTAELMFDELHKLKSINSAISDTGNQIAGLPNPAKAKELSKEDLFPHPKRIEIKDGFQEHHVYAEKQETYLGQVKKLPENIAPESSSIRQSAIIDLIRQSGNCRLRDLQVAMPDISERTLRYDLQNLVQKGIIERIGQSGPATHYCLK